MDLTLREQLEEICTRLPKDNHLVPLKGGDRDIIHVYPRSVHVLNGHIFFVSRHNSDKYLSLLSPAANGRYAEILMGESRTNLGADTLIHCTMSHHNAGALRQTVDFTRPVLIGLDNSIGLGDRLGIANPGHLRAVEGTGIRTILAQQSIRELERTERTPEQVMDAATWAVFQEGYKDGFGADADHLKSTDHIDLMVKAGFMMITIDPGDHVVNEADTLPSAQLKEHVANLSWDILESTPEHLIDQYADRSLRISGRLTLCPNEKEVLRTLVKYGNVMIHTIRMAKHLHDNYPDYPVELELSVDETDSVTSPFEHYLVVNELRRLGIQLISLAPRFAGDFEKGIDYKGSLDIFGEEFLKHVDIAEHLGPYKLSFHSGSDKFRVYDLVGSLGEGRIHIKTAGTSYLEALRTVASVDPSLFREILDFARALYETEKRTYHVSADPEKVHQADTYSDGQLSDLFNQDDARQVLHVTFGRVLTEKDKAGEYLFRDRVLELLRSSEDVHYENLRRHFRRHIEPFLK
jgi:hypothetical protein